MELLSRLETGITIMLKKLLALFGFYQVSIHVFYFLQDLTQNNDSFTIELSKFYST